MLAYLLFGVYIVRWRARRAIPRSAKWFATLAMLCSGVMLQFTGLPLGQDMPAGYDASLRAA